MAADGFRLGVVDFVICFLTVGVSVTTGLYQAFCGKNHSSLLQYFIGNRRLGAIPVALSVAVSYMSSGLVVGLPAEKYHYGLPGIFHGFMVGIAIVLSSWIAAPLWYELNITSTYEYLELRFKSRIIRMAGSALGILQNIFIDIGAMDDFWESLIAGKRIRMLQFNPDPTIRTSFWSISIGGLTLWCTIAFSQQGAQRIMSMKNLDQAKKVLPYSIPAFYLFLVIALIAGLGAYGHYVNKGCDPYVQGVINDVNGILPYFVIELCQDLPGLPGLFMASLLSASLSTMSSCMNSIAAVALTDFVQAFKLSMTDSCATWTAKSLDADCIHWCGKRPSLRPLPLRNLYPVGECQAPSDRCWLNQSTVSNYTDLVYLYNTSLVATANTDFPVYTDLPYSGSGLKKLYSMSYMLYPTIGLVLTILVGVIVSLITGRMNQSDVNPLCISHIIRRRYYKPKDETTEEGQLELMVNYALI
ncbi:sodium-coupled monocarboxylate transporter 1-like [Liolophura sinensis]|uniref:sodium-coupled monocarboxylate transporter 1-like n=1 Tax=Liolophura sinensis TaxID=3198878 RepID=UPI00315811F2